MWESLKGEAEETACAVSVTLDYKQLLLMAVATSIDACCGHVCIFERGHPACCDGHRLHDFCDLPGGCGDRDLFRRPPSALGGDRRRCDPDPSGWKILLEHLGIL